MARRCWCGDDPLDVAAARTSTGRRSLGTSCTSRMVEQAGFAFQDRAQWEERDELARDREKYASARRSLRVERMFASRVDSSLIFVKRGARAHSTMRCMTRPITPYLARAGAVALLVFFSAALAAAPAGPSELAALYRSRVDRVLEVPADEVRRYQRLTDAALMSAKVDVSHAQYLLVVDRDPRVQAALLLWRSGAGEYRFIGASPVSTGRRGEFDHFETPAGVFDHSPSNPDFRAEGTFNSNGIRGYGDMNMRVYDFGWQPALKGWGDGAVMEMRLQMHATDPDLLERRLGSSQSKGCVRIPATLNTLLDRYGVLDAEYELLAAAWRKFWVLKEDRETVADPGRYLVIVDSGRSDRPEWSPAPSIPRVRRPSPPSR
jgi:hypothetical protein